MSIFDKHKLVGKFGISYLDNNLHGILQSDLILIGARSGAGKTTISNHIAYHNALNGIKVSLFSLEDFEHEFELTAIYKECCKIYPHGWIDFRQFKSRIKEFPTHIENEAKEETKRNMSKILLVSRNPSGFNIQNLAEKFVEHARAGAQLVIIDHIDYFDFHNPQVSENQNISEIMRETRKLQDVYNIPVIMISHLKKGLRDTIIPTLEDFMGTSNKVKEATTVILLAPHDVELSNNASNIRHTWICIRKERGMGVFNTACKIGFDLQKKEYQTEYKLHEVNYWGTKISEEINVQTTM